MEVNTLKKHIYIPDESSQLAIGQALAKACKNQGAFIYLCGELGAGKTTLVRGFLQGLGYQKRVKSPTYTLVEPYEVAGRQIYHFDFYRISEQTELEYLGLEEYFISNNICLVEWPDYFMDSLPVPDILIFLTADKQGRQMQVQSQTTRGAVIMENFLDV